LARKSPNIVLLQNFEANFVALSFLTTVDISSHEIREPRDFLLQPPCNLPNDIDTKILVHY